uniref:Uncharacterized protein n=1 Tax=Bombyx mori TaxID=7091 RepID=A0A8R2M458_BOMMO|nr:uncharacterized protein LOC101742592 [Bombyx mori]
MNLTLFCLIAALLCLAGLHRVDADYLWHDDEIPYEANAKCQRGHSYYTNDVNANDTTIDVGSDVESLLDYSNKDVCYYCVCSARGREVGCISRRPWYCEYYRVLREGDAPRDMYRQTLQQDRPAYFRQLSYRLRRTMDAGIFDLVDSVGGEPTGKKCVPFVSQYDDCNAENQCMGCTKCTCTAQGTWSCKKEKRCSLLEREPVDEEDIDNALQLMEIEMKNERMKQASSSSNPLVPSPPKLEDLVIGYIIAVN